MAAASAAVSWKAPALPVEEGGGEEERWLGRASKCSEPRRGRDVKLATAERESGSTARRVKRDGTPERTHG